jgi:hypothetical protein
MKVFPYFATPNMDLQTVAESVELAAAPDEVWSLVGQFGSTWHPEVARVRLTGTGIGQLRTIETPDGQTIVERLEAIDDANRFLRYTNIAGMPVSQYTGALEVQPKGRGCVVEWRAQFLANHRSNRAAKSVVSTLVDRGLASLKSRFGAAR